MDEFISHILISHRLPNNEVYKGIWIHDGTRSTCVIKFLDEQWYTHEYEFMLEMMHRGESEFPVPYGKIQLLREPTDFSRMLSTADGGKIKVEVDDLKAIIAYEYIAGRPLDMIDRDEVDTDQLYIDLSHQLDSMHRNGFVYNDLHANNVILDQHGHYRLIDFGLVTSTTDPAAYPLPLAIDIPMADDEFTPKADAVQLAKLVRRYA